MLLKLKQGQLTIGIHQIICGTALLLVGATVYQTCDSNAALAGISGAGQRIDRQELTHAEEMSAGAVLRP
jgi:hypothetical protein